MGAAALRTRQISNHRIFSIDQGDSDSISDEVGTPDVLGRKHFGKAKIRGDQGWLVWPEQYSTARGGRTEQGPGDPETKFHEIISDGECFSV